MNSRLRVLILKQPPEMGEPWMSDLLEALGADYDLREFDRGAPVAPQFEGIDAVIDQGGSLGTREMADCCGSLKLWQVLGTGFDKLDIAYWRSKRIPVSNTPGQFSAVPLAECALMYMLMLAHRWHPAQENLRQGVFYQPFGEELDGRRLGLVGFGASARELARRARPFGLRISAIDIREIPDAERDAFGLEFAGQPAALDSVIANSDFLSLHLHLNNDTRGIMDERRIRLMPRGSYFINVARGGLVDQGALYRALVDGHLAGAGLDVFATEPLDPADPILKLPNVVATPHVSGTTRGTSRRRAACVADNLARLARGLDPLHRVDVTPGELAAAGKA
jgi:phosphoglycerate dehydrogenase-like enzyme